MLIGLALVGTVVAAARPAGAHPLGNFTTNRYARVEVSAGVLRVYYVLDYAELRTVEVRDALAGDRQRFVADQVASLRRGLEVTVDGELLDLAPAPARLDLLAGQGGLDTLRLAVVLSAPLRPGGGVHRGVFADRNEPERIGWREVVVVARGDARVLASSAPATDVSDELRRYPADLLQAPLDERSAEFTFEPGTRPVEPLRLEPPLEAASRAGGRVARLVERRDLTPFALAGMLAVAFLVGSSHALGPGHGKTVMAAYLVGTKGRRSDALVLGLVVSLMHTGSVIVLGVVLLNVGRVGGIERLYPLLTVISGLIVAGCGAVLLRRRLRPLLRRGKADHDHVHDDHHGHGHPGDEHHHDHPGDQHHHGHGHDPEHHGEQAHDHGFGSHTHELPEGARPLSRRGLVLLATSGGILPSPSAVLVVVAGFASGRVALGLSLVLAFSLGLAATLSAVGLALVLGRRVLERRGRAGAAVRALPVAGAAALVGVGLVLVGTGVAQL